MDKPAVFKMEFRRIYPMYLQKVEKKGRTKAELDQIIFWLTGYEEVGLQAQLDSGASLEAFFEAAPQMNENAALIKGVVCGVRVEDVEDEMMQKIRWLDKLVDELARGKAMEKILRS